MEEIVTEIQKTLFYIEEYYKGNNEYYKEIVNIISDLNIFGKSLKSHLLKMKLIVNLSKFVTNTFYHELTEYNFYNKLLDEVDILIEKYEISSKTYLKYLQVCNKKEQYPDLDVEYILSINISLLLSKVSEILSHIRRCEDELTMNSRVSIYNYNIDQISEIDYMIDLLNKDIDEQKKR